MMPKGTYCQKPFQINRNVSTGGLRLVNFPEFLINHESQRQFQLAILVKFRPS